MATLDRRIEELERKVFHSDEPLFIFVRFVSPGRLDAPTVRAEFEGSVVARAEGEADEAFEARVKREAQKAHPGRRVTLVKMFPEDLDL